MSVYTQINDTTYITEDGGTSFPADESNYLYVQMMAEVAAGESSIIAPGLTLDDLKASKKVSIDAKTDVLIEQGITHNSVEFKINLEKEITALGLNSARMAGADMAGKKFRARNQTYTFVDTADFDIWFNAAFTRVESLLISGSELKDQVDAAADQAALDAIVDNRV